jgi:hypothetical protein
MSITTTNIPFIIKTGGSITLFLKGESTSVARDHPNYDKIVDALKKGENDKIENLINVAKAVTSYSGGRVRIDNGQIFYGTLAVHNTLTIRILKMMADGFKVDHMLRFLDNLMQNASATAVEETYTFLENFGLPITDDGCFLAYKAVNSDYKDIYSGKFDNRIGQTPSMIRNQVDDTFSKDCSHGLHVGALDYVVQYGHFIKGQVPSGNHLLIVKVNPKNVVSVPKFASFTKMRVCEYTVVSEITDVVRELDKIIYTATATPLAPDNKPAAPVPSAPAGVEVFNPDDYQEGYDNGELDRSEDENYGYRRDYTAGKSYRKGYNDGYKLRMNRKAECVGAKLSHVEDDVSDTEDCADEAEYNHGYDLGEDDALNGESFQSNLDIDESDSFKEGYEAGYNDHR